MEITPASESRRNVDSVDKQGFDKTVFIGHLSRICGENIITDKPRLAVYEADGLTAKKQIPSPSLFLFLPVEIWGLVDEVLSVI